MNDKKCCGHIKGVVCDVKNCAYHDGETRCTAGEITVGPTYASTSNKDDNALEFIGNGANYTTKYIY